MRLVRIPGWLLFVAFVVVPLVEVFVLVQVGQVIGPWWTILLLIGASVLGAWLIKREGSRSWAALRDALQTGRMPARELADATLILIGGTLMLTPGFVSDVLGVLLILPFTRPIARGMLTRIVATRLLGPLGVVHRPAAPGTHDAPARAPTRGPWSGAKWSTTESSATERSGDLALLGVGAVQVRRADLTATEQLETLLEDVLELLLRSPLQEHVPVRAGGLLGLLLGLDARRAECLRPTARALPDGRDVRLDGHRDLELVTLLAAVSDLLSGRELDPALVLETLAAEPCAT